MALEIQINHATRDQVYLERLKSAEVKRADELLRKVDAEIRAQLSGVDLPDYKRAQLEDLLKSVDKDLASLYAAYGKELQGSFGEIAGLTANRETQFLNHIAPEGVSFSKPTVARLAAAVRTAPLSVKGYNAGKLLGPFIDDMSKNQRDLFTGSIRQGYYQGKSTPDIIKAIRGTKAANYTDGLLQIAKRDAEAIVRTGIQHVAAVAKNEVYENNSDLVIGYEWVSTLDNRTSQTCRSLDGLVFKPGKGPLPPAHINCRSTTVPKLDPAYDWLDEGATRAARGPDGKSRTDVPANKSYYEWLKGQPAEFQDDALGPTLGKLFRDGGLPADEFARLNLGRSFQPLTIAEMREKDPLAFARAGLSGKTIDRPPSAKAVPKAAPKPAAQDDAYHVDYVRDSGLKEHNKAIEYASISFEDGSTLLQKRGQRSSVNFTGSELDAIRKHPDRLTLYHNHPSGGSFSSEDLIFATGLKLKEIVAVGNKNGSIFRANPLKSEIETKKASEMANKLAQSVTDELYYSQQATPDEANLLYPHLRALLLDHAGVIKYTYSEGEIISRLMDEKPGMRGFIDKYGQAFKDRLKKVGIK